MEKKARWSTCSLPSILTRLEIHKKRICLMFIFQNKMENLRFDKKNGRDKGD